MLFRPRQDRSLGELQKELRRATGITPELMSEVIVQACSRFAAPRFSEQSAHIRRLLDSQGWLDAVLALVDLELPSWKLRRVVYEDAEWVCTLSTQRQLADWLDDVVEARHEILPLAVLVAFIEAQQERAGSVQPDFVAVPRVRAKDQGALNVVCCENYS